MHEVRTIGRRLVTLRVVSPVDDQEAGDVFQGVRRAVGSLATQVVICTDLTEARTFSPPIAARFTELMRADNPKVERSGFLLAQDAATFSLQLERMIRESKNPHRRTFTDAAELERWLAPLLTVEERSHLRSFLFREPRPRS
jgi:hypothetical protein